LEFKLPELSQLNNKTWSLCGEIIIFFKIKKERIVEIKIFKIEIKINLLELINLEKKINMKKLINGKKTENTTILPF
tara:strand:+ start:14063 stop:14293 length:231 start_codon:yes stop_codon:yes gene_type:complete